MPETGEVRTQLVWRQLKGGVQAPLRLPPAGSVFVVFREGEDKPSISSIRSNGVPLFPHSPGVERDLGSISVASGGEDDVVLTIWQPGDYVLKTYGDCPKCEGKMVISSIYHEEGQKPSLF